MDPNTYYVLMAAIEMVTQIVTTLIGYSLIVSVVRDIIKGLKK